LTRLLSKKQIALLLSIIPDDMSYIIYNFGMPGNIFYIVLRIVMSKLLSRGGICPFLPFPSSVSLSFYLSVYHSTCFFILLFQFSICNPWLQININLPYHSIPSNRSPPQSPTPPRILSRQNLRTYNSIHETRQLWITFLCIIWWSKRMVQSKGDMAYSRGETRYFIMESILTKNVPPDPCVSSFSFIHYITPA